MIDRVQGRELADTWYTMTFTERMAMMEKIVDIESIRVPASGSLFFKESLDTRVKSMDIPHNSSLKGADRFCIGLSTEYLWWYQSEMSLLPTMDLVSTVPLFNHLLTNLAHFRGE